MVYKFRIISDEVDDFLREIKIDSEASFYDLHEAILKCCKYKDDQMTSFFICDDDWEKEKEENLVFYPAGSPIPRGKRKFRRRYICHERYPLKRASGRRKTKNDLCFRPIGRTCILH